MLPEANNSAQYQTIDLRNPIFMEAARTVLTGLSKTGHELSFPSNGSLPVVLTDDVALKFFPPVFADEVEREITAIHFLSSNGRFSPKLLGSGQIGGWQYVLMSRLKGKSLKELWPNLSENHRQAACQDIGKSLRLIHDLDLSSQNFDLSSWTGFLDAQKQACFARHEKLGLREDLLKQIPAFLESVDLNSSSISFLHTEIMRDHVFFEEIDGHISFQGYIDFEPSMVGEPDYDFASVGVFLSSGDRGALRSFFAGYGILDRASDREFRRRIMAYALLHKYSNLKWYLQFMPNADSLEELADLWWAT